MNQVTIDQGTLIGGHATTSNGFNYIEFLEIPYAQPPLGDLRFKAPQPPQPWNGERNATVFNPNHVAIQTGILDTKIRGSEDCLYLNVYTPRVVNILKLLPVMVYIHGGGFNLGTGIFKPLGGPDYLIEHDVVIVTINYRLNVFGFLSLDIPEAAGNMGLKDQVMALKWIQNNIEKFGGNKNDIAIYGHSAGSSSVHFHILSPLSKNLFHRGIAISGTSLDHWALRTDVKDASIKLAIDIGYQGPLNDTQHILQFLMQSPQELIMKSYKKFAIFLKTKGSNYIFVPSIEKDFGNGEAFITDYPYNLIKDGKLNKAETIFGFAEIEGLFFFALKPYELKELYEKKNYLNFWTYEMSLKDNKTYNTKFNELYNDNDDVNFKGAIDFFSDYDFVSGTFMSAELMSNKGLPVYVFMFSYDGNSNYFKIAYNITHKGACHVDDMSYIHKLTFPVDITPYDEDLVVMKRTTKMLTDFAKSSNPTPSTSDLIPVQWPLYNCETKQYLVIDRELDVRSDYCPEKMAVFREIYEKYGK